jgi:hypothetical protein
MKARSVVMGSLLLAGASLGWWSCSSDKSSEQPKTEAGAAGAAATGGGTGGASGGSGGAGAAGGAGGTGNSGGTWGPAPDWEPTNIVGVPCPVERLANASEIRMFSWEPCPWAPNDCERAVFNSALVSQNATFSASVDDDGTTVRVGLGSSYPKLLALFGTDSGQGLVGLRPASPSSDCLLGAFLHGKRFAVSVAANVTPVGGDFGGILGDLDATTQPLLGFTLAAQPPGGPQGDSLGTSRWLMWWAPTYAYTSVSALDGSDYELIATTMPPSDLLYLGPPVTTGKLFLLDAVLTDDAGVADEKILYSDGTSAPAVYLEPTEPDTYYGSPVYANSHVAFFKGTGFQDINKYSSVELWASPYSESPSELKPQKLAAMPFNSMPGTPRGGWGFAAFDSPAGVNKWDIVVWNLADGTQKTHALPAQDRLMGLVGVTRQHAWLTTTNFTYTQYYLLRFRND